MAYLAFFDPAEPVERQSNMIATIAVDRHIAAFFHSRCDLVLIRDRIGVPG